MIHRLPERGLPGRGSPGSGPSGGGPPGSEPSGGGPSGGRPPGGGSAGNGAPPLALDLTETYVFLGRHGRTEAVPLTDAVWDEVVDLVGDGAQLPPTKAAPPATAGRSPSPDTALPMKGEEAGEGSAKGPSPGAPGQEGAAPKAPGSGLPGSAMPGATPGATPGSGVSGPDAPGSDVPGWGAGGAGRRWSGSHAAALHGDGWYVSAFWLEANMATWERHASGERLMIAQSGAFTLVLEYPDGSRELQALNAAGSVLVPCGCWHRLTVNTPGMVVFITPSHGMEHRLA